MRHITLANNPWSTTAPCQMHDSPEPCADVATLRDYNGPKEIEAGVIIDKGDCLFYCDHHWNVITEETAAANRSAAYECGAID